MDHYENRIGESDEERRERIIATQRECEHKDWKVVVVNQQGEPLFTRCQQCDIVYNVKEDKLEGIK